MLLLASERHQAGFRYVNGECECLPGGQDAIRLYSGLYLAKQSLSIGALFYYCSVSSLPFMGRGIEQVTALDSFDFLDPCGSGFRPHCMVWSVYKACLCLIS